MFIKNNKKITITIKAFYPNDNSICKTIEVNEDTYEFLCSSKRKEESKARKDRRYCVNFAFDEIAMGERDGIFSDSLEEKYFKIDEYALLHKAISLLSEYEQRLILNYYFEKKKLIQMEAELKIPKSTISRHLIKTKENLKKHYLKLMQDI